MISNRERIYEDYRQADFSDRLNIYLQFPELRNDFLEIDLQEEVVRSEKGRDKACRDQASSIRTKRFQRLFSLCGFQRRLNDWG